MVDVDAPVDPGEPAAAQHPVQVTLAQAEADQLSARDDAVLDGQQLPQRLHPDSVPGSSAAGCGRSTGRGDPQGGGRPYDRRVALTPALAQLAAAYGVVTKYEDWQDQPVEVPEETIVAVLTAMGVATDDPEASLAARDEEPWRRTLPACRVVVEGAVAGVDVHAPADAVTTLHVDLEDGGRRDLAPAEPTASGAAPETRTVDGVALARTTYALPTDLPLGYHALVATVGAEQTSSAPLIVTPARLGLPASLGERHGWGFAAQLYSVRSQQSWGVGDLADLADLAVFSADLGADYLLVNPLHAAEPVAPLEPSPYLPTTRRFPSPLYLRVERIVEYVDLPDAARAEVERLAEEVHTALDDLDAIDRDTSWTAKRRALRLVHAVPRTPGRQRAFAAFRRREGEALTAFATWRALAAEHGPDFRTWPTELRDAGSDAVAAAAEDLSAEVELECWLQWVLDEQLRTAQAEATGAGMALGTMHDLAVGVHPGGADAWRMRSTYAEGVRVGAPPDAFNQRGQDWGQPPWTPNGLAETGFEPFREMVAALLRHAGGVRIDHVIGLFRLWWVPEDRPASEGTYVRYDHESILGVLALEAQRAGAVVVGEDLGVVEDSAREYLLERGILGTSILWFERDQDGAPRPAQEWRELCLASVTTHDLPPTAGYLDGVHVDLRADLDLLTRPVADERASDEAERASWLAEVRRQVDVDEDAGVEETVAALHAYLALTPSRLRCVALTDAVGDRRTQNQPGTADEYPNWRIPLSGPDGRPLSLEGVLASDRARSLAQVVNP